MVGQTISHYRIVSALGAGGMGVVYEAHDARLNRSVALKFLPPDLRSDAQALERFRLEARAASALNHPNICTIYDIGEHDGRPFIVMELLKGETLRHRIGRGALRPSEVVDYGIQLADGLDVAHGHGIVHRDIKPANILITERGLAKILDFGVAKLSPRAGGAAPAHDGATVAAESVPDELLTMPGTTLGTVSYMSPEQARGEALDARTDVFSLGVVLYEMATGHQAFPGGTSAVVFDAILNRAPVAPVLLNPHTHPRLQEIINNALEKDRELRYQTAADLRADLKRLKRDVESGSSKTASSPVAGTARPDDVTTLLSGADSGRAATSAARVSAAGSQAGAAPAGGTAPTARPAAETGRTMMWTALAAAAVVAVLGAVYFTRDAGPAAPATDGSLALAATAFASRDYAGAIAHADAVLSRDAGNAEALRIRTDAQSLVDRFTASVAGARQALAAGELDRAVQALTVAQSLQPTHADTMALSAAITDALRARPRGAGPEPAGPRQTQPTTSTAVARTPAVPPPAPAAATERAAAEPPTLPGRGLPAPAVGTVDPTQRPPTTGAPVSLAPPPTPVPQQKPPEPPAARSGEPSTPPPARPPDDRAAIEKLIADYERAIEAKDLAAFRRIKPNLSNEEEGRLRASFRAVSSQDVQITVQSIEISGSQATARIARRDTLEVDGRRQTASSSQLIRFTREAGGWVMTEIGR